MSDLTEALAAFDEIRAELVQVAADLLDRFDQIGDAARRWAEERLER